MADGSSREQKKARTRQALLAAAGALIASYGAEATSLDRIAEEAGFTKGAIYSNFSNKEELILALADMAGTTVELGDIIDGTAPMADQFEALGRVVAREGRSISRAKWRLNMEIFQFVLRNAKAGARALELARESRRRDGEKLDRIASTRGERLPMTGAELVTLLSALALGLAQQQALDPSAVPDDLFAKAFRLLLGPGR